MKRITKLLFILIVFAASYLLFNTIEFDLLNQASNRYLQSLIFSTTLVVVITTGKFKVKLMYIALIFIIISGALYYINQLHLSNSAAAIGIGMLFIIALSYLPQIIKNET